MEERVDVHKPADAELEEALEDDAVKVSDVALGDEGVEPLVWRCPSAFGPQPHLCRIHPSVGRAGRIRRGWRHGDQRERIRGKKLSVTFS